MARVPAHTLSTAPEASRPALEQQAKRLGKVIHIHGEMAHSPVLIDLYTLMEAHLRERSSLGEPVRQAIHLTVAEVNACAYCQAAYTGAAKASGFSEEETIQIRRGEVEGRDELNALLLVARQIAADKGYVDDVAWKTALAAGWSEEQLLEVYAEVVRTIFTNYFNHLVLTEMDLSPAPELPPEGVDLDFPPQPNQSAAP